MTFPENFIFPGFPGFPDPVGTLSRLVRNSDFFPFGLDIPFTAIYRGKVNYEEVANPQGIFVIWEMDIWGSIKLT